MNKEELIISIEKTLEEISKVKQQVQNCLDPQEQKKLRLYLKELRYKQLWQIDLLERSDK